MFHTPEQAKLTGGMYSAMRHVYPLPYIKIIRIFRSYIGLLLGEMIENMKKIENKSQNSKKLNVYSAVGMRQKLCANSGHPCISWLFLEFLWMAIRWMYMFRGNIPMTRTNVLFTEHWWRHHQPIDDVIIDRRKKCFLFPLLNGLLKTIKKINLSILITFIQRFILFFNFPRNPRNPRENPRVSIVL